MTKRSPFKCFKGSPEIIRLAVMLYIRFPLSLRNVEDLLHERGIEISHETVRSWWQRFGPLIVPLLRARRIEGEQSSNRPVRSDPSSNRCAWDSNSSISLC